MEDIHADYQKDQVLGECFPGTKRLIQLILIIPLSTAPVERSSFQMSNVVTKKRNRLSQQQFDALIKVIHQKEELCDQDLDDIIDIFKPNRNMCLLVKSYLKMTKVKLIG
ncbi:hypothetical protein DPMN_164140 [Dreissena polymorpha]|uniref:HAT C-terminal dimerisation domain-containing protein n=1 Tax=Dreissena polymorpha TaxID=45954 RepID=A0A9D4ET51_DREPO|nr:hypothetical protein DPMN_164140 [Dreissena polymorpha]